MLRIVLISAAAVALLGSSAIAASPCDALTNPILKKACLAKPPTNPCDPSAQKPPGNQCPVSK